MQISGDMTSTAKWVLAVLLVVLGIVASTKPGPSTRRIEIEVSAGRTGTLQVFFDTGKGFNEAQSERVKVGTTRGVASIAMPADGVVRLRVDPDPKQPWIRFHKFRIEGAVPAAQMHLALSGLRPRKGIAEVSSAEGYVEARMAGGNDPQLVLDLGESERSAHFGLPGWLTSSSANLFLLLALVVTAIGAGTSRRDRFGFSSVPWMLLIAGALVLGMAFSASTTKPVHPDEFGHVRSATYYFDHWLPGAVSDPKMAATYDPIWGISYINQWDVVYFLAAKTASLWGAVTSEPVVALRLFNVILLVGLAYFASLRREFALACSALLLTPQAWYVFAYFNGDALPLCLSMVAVALVAAEESPASRFIRQGGKPTWQVLLLAVAIGLLLVSKRNYLVVVFFVGMVLIWRHLTPSPWAMLVGFLGATLAIARASSLGTLAQLWPVADKVLASVSLALLGIFSSVLVANLFRNAELRPMFRRMTAVLLLAGVVAVPRVALDVWVNGLPKDKAVQLVAAAEVYAQPKFKPSTLRNDIDSAHPGLRFAQRGVSIQEMLWARHAWIERSWRSSLGVYGYMNVYAPPATYWLLSIGVLLFGASVLARSLRSSPMNGLLWIGLGSMMLVVISSMSFSWFYGYQPQGRYLLAGVPILGAVVAATIGRSPASRSTRIALIACFAVSVVSFAVALGRIP